MAGSVRSLRHLARHPPRLVTAVLRVTASRPVAPAQSKWPTAAGVWAFEVIVPVSLALEAQTWMEDRSLASLWLPASPPGLCKQCALGERVCVQTRMMMCVLWAEAAVARVESARTCVLSS